MNKARNNLIRWYLILLICSLLTACSILDPTGESILEVTETSPAKISPTKTKSIPKPTVTPPVSVPAEDTQSSIEEVIADLQGLPIDQFFDESFKQLLLRDPELLTELNLSEQFGLRNDQLNNLSDAFVRDTQHLEAAILELLRSYDRETLTPDQQLSYDIYEWTLDDLIRGHEFMYYDYPLTFFITSYDFNLNSLLTELHQLNDRQDAEDYISRLAQVDSQVEQLLEGLALREEAGIIPPDFVISMTLGNLNNNLGMPSGNPNSIDPQQLPVFSVFNDSVEDISELSSEEKMAFRDSSLQEIETSYIPAFLKLIDYLEHLQPIATDQAGVWKFSNGGDYYAYTLRKETSTDLTPDEIHELGLAEVTRIKEEMREAFTELGYPQEQSFSQSLNRAITEGGAYDTSTQTGKDDYIAAIEAIIQEADQRMDEVFDIGPSWGVEVVPGSSCCYYVPGAPDGSRPGAYHTNVMSSRQDKFTQPTIAYHEAVPGHHYQIATAQTLDLPMFRRGGGINGFVEGWALYAERLAWEMGLYENDPYGNIGRLQYELLRAVRLVTDTGIHAKGWTREEARSYIDETMGAPGYFSHEVDRYIVWPAQATGYKIGMLKILELRQRAMDQLGDQFDIKEFHNLVIGNGSLPLEILERLINEYIQTTLNQ